MRAIANDDRFYAVKSASERRNVFGDYVIERKKIEKVCELGCRLSAYLALQEAQRQAEIRMRDDFRAMLKENRKLTGSTRYKCVGRHCRRMSHVL